MKRISILILAVSGIFLLSRCGSTNSKTKYQVSFSAVPSNGGSVSPTGGEYEEGKKLDISATPADSSWKFDNWSGDYQGPSSSATITVNEAKNIKAHFSKKNFDLTVNTQGQGTVDQKVVETSSANGYEVGTAVELTAKPATGWTFVKWKGDLSTDENPTQITVDKAKEVTAVFEKKSYQLTVHTQGQGAVNQKVIQPGSVANYDYDTTVQLTANPSKGWKFVKWTGDLTGSENPDQITIDQPKEVTAIFEKKKFAVSVSVSGKGTVTKEPDQENYVYNSTIDLTANPETGYKFVKWQGDINATENPLTVTVDTTKDITAVFEKKSFALKINLNGKGSVAKNPDQNEYKFQTTVDLTAKPDQGWKFVKWTGDISTTDNPTQITVDKTKNVTAVFGKKQYSINTSTQGDGNINVSPQKENYQYNDEVQFTANAAKGYAFINWTSALSGNENPQTLQITGNTSVKAIFKTYDDALTSDFHASVIIGDRVHQASLSLANELPNPILLKKIIIKDGDGNTTTDHDVGEKIETNKSLGFSLSYGIPPTKEDFKKLTIIWKCEYKGKSIEKEGDATVSTPDFPFGTNSTKPTKIIHIKSGNKN